MFKVLVFSLAVAGMAWAGPCSPASDVWNESHSGGDSGGLPGNADITAGVGPLDTICGSISDSTNGVDMYEINITGTTFTATASDRGSSTLDPSLFLFDASDDALYGDESGSLSLTGLTPGLYYLAITPDGNDPTHGGTDIFTLGPGLLTPSIVHTKINGWDGGGDSTSGAYVISLTDAGFAQAPEPATFGFVGAGLLGLGIFARRRETPSR